MLQTQQCCLIIIDIQGKLAQLAHDKETVFNNIEVLIKTAKALAFPIIWCEQNPKALGPTIKQLSELLKPDLPVEKFSLSCCGSAKFSDRLKVLNPRQILLCGIEAHVCV